MTMPEIIFIEGVSGAGKTTAAAALRDILRKNGCEVKCFLEFDFANPIDFYCTAYFTKAEYVSLLARHSGSRELAERYSVPAGKAVLVRYYEEDTPLFEEPLLTEMRRAEFCWKPEKPVPLEDYTEAYRAVWRGFAENVDPGVRYYIFDGSLLHHPINDMMRNYHAGETQAAVHVRALLDALGDIPWRVYYLYPEDVGGQLALAHKNRRQEPPTEDKIRFWEERRRIDQYVLDNEVGNYRSFNVTENGWDKIPDIIAKSLEKGGEKRKK